VSKQTIKSTSITSDTRDQLNENFTELYSGKVPYTGATGTLDLGGYKLITTEIESSGNITLDCGTDFTIVLEEPVWEDLRFPATQTKRGSLDKPDFDYTNIGLLFPQNDTAEVAYFIVQMPHAYKLGTDLKPHIHFIQSAVTVPVFKLVYRWYNNGGAVPAYESAIATSSLKYTYTSGSILQIASFPYITSSASGLSSILDIKLYRDDNVVTGDVLVKEFDIHFQADSFGSSTEYIKFQGD